MNDHDPLIGKVIAGRHRIDSVVGEGGFATVYRGVDVETGEVVAVKVLDEELRDSTRNRARFEREAEAVRLLTNPHTVGLLGHGDFIGAPYIVFEFVHGQDLAEVLAIKQKLQGDVVLHILRQVLHSLREAHAAGIIHRDLKPENIRISQHNDDPWFATVLDFGVARMAAPSGGNLTLAGEIIGTPRYMSPEQLLGEDPGPSSDIYSVGMVAMELLLGRASLHGNRWADQFTRLESGHFFAPTGIANAQVVGLIQRMTARVATERYQSADEVLLAIEELDQNRTIDRTFEAPPELLQSVRAPRRAPPGDDTTPRDDTTRPDDTTLADALVREEPTLTDDTTLTSEPTESPPVLGDDTTVERQVEQPNPLVPETIAAPDPPPDDTAAKRSTIWPTLAAFLLGVSVTALAFFSFSRGPEPDAAPTLADGILNPPAASGSQHKAPVDEPVVAPEKADDAGRVNEQARTENHVRPEGCPNPPSLGTVELKDNLGLLHVPESYVVDKPHPLVVMLHHTRQDPERMFRESGAPQAAEPHGFVLLAPPARGVGFQKKDLSRIMRAIEAATSRACLDLKQVFVVGHASAGYVAHELSCVAHLAGVATHGWAPRLHRPPHCQPSPAVPYMFVHGRDDPFTKPVVNSADGRMALGACSNIAHDAPADVDQEWMSRNRCVKAPVPWGEATDAWSCTELGSCDARVVSCSAEGGPTWPDGHNRSANPNCSFTNPTHPIISEMFAFFAELGPRR